VTLKQQFRNFYLFRRSKILNLETAFYRLFSNTKNLEKHKLAKDKVKHIILIRHNKGIGNIYFLLPFVGQIRAAYRNVRIDMMLNEP
jgi:hypothetical protein